MAIYCKTELYHHGIKGQKWGVRRFQNEDGSLKSAGKKRYYTEDGTTKTHSSIGNRIHSKAAKNIQRDADDLRKHGYKKEADAVQKVADKQRTKAQESQRKYDEKHTPEAITARNAKIKKAAKVGAVVAGSALAAYGAKKLYDANKEVSYEKGKSILNSLTAQESHTMESFAKAQNAKDVASTFVKGPSGYREPLSRTYSKTQHIGGAYGILTRTVSDKGTSYSYKPTRFTDKEVRNFATGKVNKNEVINRAINNAGGDVSKLTNALSRKRKRR